MCESISGDLTNYEIVLTQKYHGIGNGQQTISIASFIGNKYPIHPDINIPIKIMVGYKSNECYSSCEFNNTSNKITRKDVISNDWVDLSSQLQKMGYTLHFKKDKSLTKIESGKVIDLYEENFYNFLNAFHCETPWISGDKTIERGFDVSLVSPSSLIDLANFKIELDTWFSSNVENYDTSLFDTTRTGYIKNIIVTAYKKFYKPKIMSVAQFIELCFDRVIYPTILSENKKVTASFFTTKSNCNLILSVIKGEIEIQKLKMLV